VSNETNVSGTQGVEKSGRKDRSGRKALVALAASPTLDDQGRPIGEVAQLFEQWLTVRQASNRISSPRTVAGYCDDMARWATLLATEQPAWDRLNVADLTRNSLIAGLAAMNTAGLSVAARQRVMAPMRGLCQWLVRNGYLGANPTNDEDLEIRSAPNRLPSHFTDDELARITTVTAAGLNDQRQSLRWPERDLAAIALLAGAGLRASELCQLQWIECPRTAHIWDAHVRHSGGRYGALVMPGFHGFVHSSGGSMSGDAYASDAVADPIRSVAIA